MITEDYVSFAVAKLLKEKGFDEFCRAHYDIINGNLYHEKVQVEASGCEMHNSVLAPTLQMVMKWLREVYNLVIEPYRTACGYLYTISSVPYGSTKYDNSQAFNGDDEDSGQWSTWEKACEDGIKYCIENLI